MTTEELTNVVESLHEFNPMMGHRGCRLAVTYPEIAEMQTEAVIKAAIKVSAETGKMITPHIMIPLVGEVKGAEVCQGRRRQDCGQAHCRSRR